MCVWGGRGPEPKSKWTDNGPNQVFLRRVSFFSDRKDRVQRGPGGPGGGGGVAPSSSGCPHFHASPGLSVVGGLAVVRRRPQDTAITSKSHVLVASPPRHAPQKQKHFCNRQNWPVPLYCSAADLLADGPQSEKGSWGRAGGVPAHFRPPPLSPFKRAPLADSPPGPVRGARSK